MAETVFSAVFFVVFAAIAGYFVFGVFRYGFRGSMYGSRVLRTVGEIDLQRTRVSRTTLRVHALENGQTAVEHFKPGPSWRLRAGCLFESREPGPSD